MTRYIAVGTSGEYPIIAMYDEDDQPVATLEEANNVDLIRPDGVVILHCQLTASASVLWVN